MSKIEAGEDVFNFMESNKLGRISFYQGNEKEGYLHIRNNPDESHQIMLRDDNISKTLAFGKYYDDNYLNYSGYCVVLGSKCVFLAPDGNGVKIVTAYESKTKTNLFRSRSAIENAEVL